MEQNLAVKAVYSALDALPPKLQLNLIEKFITDRKLLNDLIDIQIIKQRMNEPDEDYEEYSRKRTERL